MSIETSKCFLAKATSNELEEYKKWLSKYNINDFQCTTGTLLIIEPFVEMDPNTARMPFFSKENSANWVVLEKWHEYQLEEIQQRLGHSSASASGSFSESKGTTRR